tara:strand:+ start:429 stop:1337 length:909 start_codon:yes stop_codon:yes gene_type:complete
MKNKKKIKILITGAKGQDGILLSKKLVSKNYRIFGLVKNIKYKNKIDKISYFPINLKNKKKVKQFILKIKPEIIVHFGSENPSHDERAKKKNFFNENYNNSKNLINSSLDLNKKVFFIFTSSSLIFKKKYGVVYEKDKFKIKDSYSKFRIKILKYLNSIKNKNFFYSNLILFNHDSKYRNEKFLLPKLINAIKNNDTNFIKEIYKSNIVGDFSHAEDICDAIYLIIKKKIILKNLILSSGKKTRINYLINYLLKKYKLKIKLNIPIVKRKCLVGNNNLARNKIKWKIKKNIFIAADEIYRNI